ncbi:MAG: hypothetical protein QXL01_00240 [Thermoplasmatales archaeon]
MDLFQEKLLKELSKKYNFDIAVFKQQSKQDFTDKLDKLETITYYHLIRLIVDAINEYTINNTHQEPKRLYSSITYLLFQIAGDILKQIDKIDKKYSEKVFQSSLELIDKTRGDKENE